MQKRARSLTKQNKREKKSSNLNKLRRQYYIILLASTKYTLLFMFTYEKEEKEKGANLYKLSILGVMKG